MNTARFYEHWGVGEDPFRAEEARQDSVLARLGAAASHQDFEKIAGDLSRPTTAVVFGEKGSGKTAIRLRIERTIESHNAATDEQRVLLIPYDDLNPVLDRLHARAGGKGVMTSLQGVRLVDHMDGVLLAGVTLLVDGLLGRRTSRAGPPPSFLQGRAKDLGSLGPGFKTDLLVLQAVYDGSPRAALRTQELRKALGVRRDHAEMIWAFAAVAVWALPLAAVAAFTWWLMEGGPGDLNQRLIGVGATVLLACAVTAKRLVWDRSKTLLLARRVLAHTRPLTRSRESMARSLRQLPAAARDARRLPVTDSDDVRYAMFARLRSVLSRFGCTGIMVVVDRVDEPTLVSGDTDRMRAVVWPMLNNKFLQMEGVGVKLLLPIELRYALFRESSAFFQEARLDKQNLVERLQWTGTTLYDMCNDRLRACLKQPPTSGAGGPSLKDLFEDAVSKQDLIEALEQMRRPRDAFKLLYRCVQDHCASTAEDDPRWQIPRHVLETVRKREVERVEQLLRGVRPA